MSRKRLDLFSARFRTFPSRTRQGDAGLDAFKGLPAALQLLQDRID
jgi:hypothetical protein